MDRTEGYPPPMNVPATPAGLEAIYKACRRLYPTQPNPLQVTAVVKYWLGGPDPLDYISMYGNPGDPAHNIPAHWHYVSFGLSDLHGDGRVHERNHSSEGISGFGFELTLRLKREEGETAPPTWPAALMQALARYVFQSENNLCAGDHVSWHQPLDGSESRIQHMLMVEDAQMHPIHTAFGTVNFVQVVGVCSEELKAAQHWNGPSVIELLKQQPVAGGSWLITDMRRGETIFEVDPQLQDTVDKGIEEEGSNLSGVSGRCWWEDSSNIYDDGEEEDKENRIHLPGHRRGSTRSTDSETKPNISPTDSEQIKAALKKGLSLNSKPVLPPIKSDHQEFHDSQSLCQRKPSVDSEGPCELLSTRVIESLHLKFNLEAGSLLPLALRGRLRHGRHFTYKSVLNDVAITLVSSSVVGSIADEHHPYAAHGPWLQVLFTDDFIDQLLEELSELTVCEEISEPLTYRWPEKKLSITIIPDDV